MGLEGRGDDYTTKAFQGGAGGTLNWALRAGLGRAIAFCEVTGGPALHRDLKSRRKRDRPRTSSALSKEGRTFSYS